MKTSVLNKFLSSYYYEEAHPSVIKRVDIIGCCRSVDMSLCLVANLKEIGNVKHTFIDLIIVYADGDHQTIYNFSPSVPYEICLRNFRSILCQFVS